MAGWIFQDVRKWSAASKSEIVVILSSILPIEIARLVARYTGRYDLLQLR